MSGVGSVYDDCWANVSVCQGLREHIVDRLDRMAEEDVRSVKATGTLRTAGADLATLRLAQIRALEIANITARHSEHLIGDEIGSRKLAAINLRLSLIATAKLFAHIAEILAGLHAAAPTAEIKRLEAELSKINRNSRRAFDVVNSVNHLKTLLRVLSEARRAADAWGKLSVKGLSLDTAPTGAVALAATASYLLAVVDEGLSYFCSAVSGGAKAVECVVTLLTPSNWKSAKSDLASAAKLLKASVELLRVTYSVLEQLGFEKCPWIARAKQGVDAFEAGVIAATAAMDCWESLEAAEQSHELSEGQWREALRLSARARTIQLDFEDKQREIQSARTIVQFHADRVRELTSDLLRFRKDLVSWDAKIDDLKRRLRDAERQYPGHFEKDLLGPLENARKLNKKVLDATKSLGR